MKIEHMRGSKIDVGQIIQLHDESWLIKQRIAGKVAAGAIDLLVGLVKEKAHLTLVEMNKMAEEYIIANACTPTFRGYKGHSDIPFPNGVCISTNAVLVHGICEDVYLNEGDVVSFDLGTTFEGAIADTATTVIFGEGKEEHKRLVAATRKALDLAIKAVAVGKRLGVIGDAIYRHGKENGYSVVETYGGHSMQFPDKPHAPPFVANRANPNDGVVLQPEMILCIEPLFVIGKSNNTRIADDGWSVIADGICSHHEDTIYFHEDHVEIITARNNG